MMRLITTDGKQEHRSKMSFEEMQAFVGGYVEVVPIKDGQVVICNEDGLSQRLPVNSVFGRFVGNIVVCAREELEGCV